MRKQREYLLGFLFWFLNTCAIDFWSHHSLYSVGRALRVHVDGSLLGPFDFWTPRARFMWSVICQTHFQWERLSAGVALYPRFSRRSQVAEGVRSGDRQILSLLFADIVILLASSNHYLWPTRSWSLPRAGFWVRKMGGLLTSMSAELQPQVE